MSYKHKSDIGHIIRGSDSLIADKKIAPVFEELDEVYRKAEAFDEMRRMHHEIDSYIHETGMFDEGEGYYRLGQELSAILTGEVKEDSQ